MKQELASSTSGELNTKNVEIVGKDSLTLVAEHFNRLQEFYGQMLKPGSDFGIIPGVAKPSLWKPGAEKLILLLNLTVKIERTGEILDLDKQFYSCSYKATAVKPNGISFDCEGSCNVFEDKYRYIYETVEGEKPTAEVIAEMTRNKMGRMKAINGINYWQIKIENMSRIGLMNTVQKIAQKRAFVGAVLVASGASTIFTQDLSEDDGDISEDLVNKAMEDLKKVVTIDELQALVERYESVYNGDTKFTQAAKDLKNQIKTKK